MAGIIQFVANKFSSLVTLNVSPQDPLPVTIAAPSSGTGITQVVAVGASGTKTVASTASPQPLVAVSTLATSVVIYPLSTNTGSAFAGYAASPQGETPVVIVAPLGKKIDISQINVRVAVNGEGVAYESLN